MPKTMALIENGIIVNTIWCSDNTEETDTFKETYEKKVQIGDEYIDGKYYRGGVEVLTNEEETILYVESLLLQLDNSYTKDELAEIYRNGVNSV